MLRERRLPSGRLPLPSGSSSDRSGWIANAQLANDVERQLRHPCQLLDRRLALQHFAERGAGACDLAYVGRPSERDADGVCLGGDRREDCLANPPHRVADEVDSDVGVVLVGRAA